MHQHQVESTFREADDVVAPFVFIYLFCVIGWLAAALAWVFWFRGYA